MTRNAITAIRAWRAIALIALSILGLVAVTAAPPAHAQCSGSANTERAIAAATTVFVGRVIETSDAGLVAQVQVLSIWKGRDLPELVEVRGSSGTAGTIDRRFDTAKTYLFIPENTRAPFLASACTATQGFPGPPNLIPTAYQDATGSSIGRAPLTEGSAADADAALVGSILPLLALIVLIGLTWAIIVVLRKSEPERAAAVVMERIGQQPAEPKARRRRWRSLKRDVSGADKLTRRAVKRNTRGFRGYRRRQERRVEAARKASGSTETS